MVERDDEIKVLGEINVELESDTHKLIEKLSQEKISQEDALEEFNSTLDNVLDKLSQEKDSPDDFYGFMYDTDSPSSEVDWQYDPLHETEDFFGRLYQSIQIVVVQNNVQQEVVGEFVFYPPIHEEVAEQVMCHTPKILGPVWGCDIMVMANDQAEALSDQEMADEFLDDE
ncbi:hypothetical protein Tco_0972922 [Tanacetum coccineum]